MASENKILSRLKRASSKSEKKNGQTVRKIHIIDENKSPFIVTESFRKLATNIGFAIPKKENGKGKVFCITSPMPGEGKSTLSVNIALTCARSGAKTVLVDCDLRKPTVLRYFPECDKHGVVAYLSGKEKSLDSIVYHSESGLDVLVTRQTPPNPLVLINSEVFDKLIEELSSKYEYVIIDTPPLGVVSDASIIEKKTDGIVVVTRQMYSNHRIIKDVVGQLEFAQNHVLGFILNDFTVSRDSYGGKYKRYGKYGKYGYRYTYRINNDVKENNENKDN